MINLINLKKTYLTLVVLSLALLAGCQKDDGEPVDSHRGKLTFKLHSPGAFLVRATGGANENGGTGDKIAFYQFSKEGKYEQKYVLNYADGVSVDGNIKSFSLELNSSARGQKKFVVVESGNENNFPNMNELSTINDLLNSKTVVESGILNPPFVMSNVKTDDKEYITIADVESSDNEANVKLKRRVARFDLLNDPAVSGVVIDKVYIKNRRNQGFIGDISGSAGNILTDILEIPANTLANNGKSFYLYPTQLTSTLDQSERTVVWATTKITNSNVPGPTLYLNLSSDINIEANYVYQLNTKSIVGSAGFDISVEEWKDGTSIDWVTIENGISTMDDKAKIIVGKEIKGNYVKVTAEATMPYIIKRVITDFNSADLEVSYDGNLPSWLTVSSSTIAAGSGLYRHEMIYTVKKYPENQYQYAVTYLNGLISDENLLVIGFTNPYPGTPLPCLAKDEKLYSPIHANQTTYLVQNNVDKAYYCGATGYVLNTDMSSIKGSEAINPCPEGWLTLNDKEAEDYILQAGMNLKSQVAGSVYTYRWFESDDEATYMRILAGYPKSKDPNLKDLAAFGTWPNVAWVNIRLSDLTIQDKTFGNQWPVKEKYGIPYRCIREKNGWN